MICGNAALDTVTVGDALRSTGELCGSLYPSLFVEGDLFMTGSINSGKAVINGKCSTESIAAKCGVKCFGNYNPSERFCENSKMFNCTFLRSSVEQLSANISKITANAGARFNEYSLLDITWAGTGKEVLKISNAGASAPLKIALNKFLGTLKQDSTIIINIDSPFVTFAGVSMAYLKYMSEYIIWNLPNTREIEISGCVKYRFKF
jgi:choice-of-anchor A domain-containing protein